MTIDTSSPPGTPPTEADQHTHKAIASGNAFIGLCTTRGVALQLFDKRVFQILATNLGGLAAVLAWFATDPPILLLVALNFSICAVLVLLRRSIQIFEGSADRVDYWTNKLKENEEVNGVDGNVLMFSSPEYTSLQETPALPVEDLIWMIYVCIVTWIIVWFATMIMALNKIGALAWILM